MSNPIDSIVERFEMSDELRSELIKNREMIDGMGKIRGYVTVIKNQGRPDEFFASKDETNLLHTDGRDFVHTQVYANTVAGTVGANFIAVSADATNPVAGDTSLLGEITVNGLQRAIATTITHTDDTNETTLSVTFTSTGSFTNIHKSAIFNAAGPPVSGIMVNGSAFGVDVANMESGDTLTVTWVLTGG